MTLQLLHILLVSRSIVSSNLPASRGRNIGYPLKYRVKLRRDYGISEAF